MPQIHLIFVPMAARNDEFLYPMKVGFPLMVLGCGWLKKVSSQQTKPVGEVLFSWIVFSIFFGGGEGNG